MLTNTMHLQVGMCPCATAACLFSLVIVKDIRQLLYHGLKVLLLVVQHA